MAPATDTATVQAPVVQAIAKYVHISPRKARLVADLVRDRSVPEARTILAFTTRAAAIEVEKVLRSAVSNAEANHGLTGDELVVKAVFVDEGPTIKRFQPRARGRVGRILKRTCHITVKVGTPDESTTQRRAKTPKRNARKGEES